MSFCAAKMMLSLNQADCDRISSSSLLVRVHCIMHPHCDISTHFIRTSIISEVNDILCRFAENTVANLQAHDIVYLLLKDILDA